MRSNVQADQLKTRMAEAENQNRPIQEWQTGEFVMLSLEHIQLQITASLYIHKSATGVTITGILH